jgi:hypothetical protein
MAETALSLFFKEFVKETIPIRYKIEPIKQKLEK